MDPVNRSGQVPLGHDEFNSDPLLERLMKSQALSHHSEMQLDQAVNRLFDDAERKKMKMEKLRMESELSQLSKTRQTPSINSKSASIAKSRGDRGVPIHKRVHQV